MQQLDPMNSSASEMRRSDSLKSLFRAIRSRVSPTTLLKRKGDEPESEAESPPALKVATYSLVLMDPEGQVIWTRDWDAGGVFEFGPRQRLLVFCGFTNHSRCETEISEYEIELMSEDGMVVKRFGDSFGDSLIVPPGESKHFQAEWRMQ